MQTPEDDPQSSASPRAPDPAQTRECPACREDVPQEARKCPRCGAARGISGIAVAGLKWTAALLTVVTLVLGIRQLVGLAGNVIESRADSALRIRVAERLVASGEYASAWDILEPIGNSRDEAVRRTRLATARRWVLHASAVEGRNDFSEMIDRVAPVIAASLSAGTAREQAENRALLGYTQFLRARVEPVRTDPADIYRRALETDPDCALAHLLLGAYLAGWTDEFQTGLVHLQRAVELRRTGQLEELSGREWQLRAIFQHMASNPYLPNPAYAEGAVALVRTLNDIRREGGAIPEPSVTLDKTRPNRYWSRIWSIYRHLPGDGPLYAALRESIPLHEHIALLGWLEDQDPGDEPNVWIIAWTGYLQEKADDKEGALETYRRVPNPPALLGAFWDDASIRLTGTPYRMLAKRDPWAHVIRTMGTASPESDEFKTAFERFEDYMNEHALGARHSDERALEAAQAAFENVSARAKGNGTRPSMQADVYASIGLALGRLLHAAGKHDEAVAVLDDVSTRLGPSHALKGEVLVALAASHAQRFRTSSASAGDLDRAVSHVREAVEQTHYADWARIRWFRDLEPLRSHPEFAALLDRHGRSVTGSFGGVRRDGG